MEEIDCRTRNKTNYNRETMRIGVSTAQPRFSALQNTSLSDKISVNQMNLPIEKTVTENVCGLNLLDYHLFDTLRFQITPLFAFT